MGEDRKPKQEREARIEGRSISGIPRETYGWHRRYQ